METYRDLYRFLDERLAKIHQEVCPRNGGFLQLEDFKMEDIKSRWRAYLEDLDIGFCRHLWDDKHNVVVPNPLWVEDDEYQCLSMDKEIADKIFTLGLP